MIKSNDTLYCRNKAKLAPLIQLCLEKVLKYDLEKRYLAEENQRSCYVLDYNKCMSEILKEVQEYEGIWNQNEDGWVRNRNEYYLMKIYHNPCPFLDQPEWCWVSYRNVHELNSHKPVLFIRSSYNSRSYKYYDTSKIPHARDLYGPARLDKALRSHQKRLQIRPYIY
jgi:hypothetical protein